MLFFCYSSAILIPICYSYAIPLYIYRIWVIMTCSFVYFFKACSRANTRRK